MKYQPQRWILDDLMAKPGSPEQVAYLAAGEERISAFEVMRDQLAPDIPETTFIDILKQYELLDADMNRLTAYSYLWFSEDTADQAALAFKAKVEQFAADAHNRTLFFELWWKALDENNAARLLDASGDMRYFLETMRLFKPYTLSEAEEKIINLKDVNGINAVITLYYMITNGFKFHLTVEGEEKELTRGQLMMNVYNPNPDIRAAAYQELYRLYGDNADVLAQIYAARVRDWYAEQVNLRGFTSPVSVRNLANDVPDEVIETLLDVIRKNVPLFQRYFHFKARTLGVEKLRRYDIYAPLSDAEKTYDFDDAVRLVDESYRAFSETLADTAQRVINEGHLDAEIRPRKMDGAYSYGPLPGITPWVLLNYTGTINDVSTLAHELGHSVHSMLAADHSVTTFHSSLPMAETASTFGEMLLTDKLLAEETDVEVRRTLLNTFLSDSYATIMRQGYFVIFEKIAHELIKNGATPDELHKAYLDTLIEQFGDAVDVSEDFRLEWLAIPHIYERPFYCYAYAFGQLLVMALYRKYREIGREAFEPQYLRILAYGGSASPEHVISEAGFDMADPAFWQGGFDLLAEMLEELEKIG
ncbi:MAG: M3 family oligoendopeptidase [Anaerolineae bacterium]|nr:M3 family oligoendopeptidase [Anaerolineae bacterium]